MGGPVFHEAVGGFVDARGLRGGFGTGTPGSGGGEVAIALVKGTGAVSAGGGGRVDSEEGGRGEVHEGGGAAERRVVAILLLLFLVTRVEEAEVAGTDLGCCRL